MVEGKIVEYVDKYNFATGGAGKLMHSLVKYSIFIQTQTAEKLVSEPILKTIKAKADALEDESSKKYKRFLHLYLCFACQLCYHKPVQEALGEEYHELMPNQDNLKACFQFVISKDKR